ncbi:hypothetical protein ID866_7841 [Astraeus odoratus]|nr:hypothetical protein ID866_7841 [Astraeus odoratus]
MSRIDKATSERHAKILRDLVKRPENKVCADCKRNDPRWASWNLGVFLCIRCSGIHRGMGTHISRVKSIDLDMWTPEQMESIQKWGNRRANLYWEAHLKAGHVPPDHKMESYIRSKYETRRWARDGPPPSDPSVLEDSSDASRATNNASEAAPATEQPAPATSRPTHAPTNSLSAPRPASPALTLNSSPFTRQHQPQPRQLLSAAVAGRTLPSTQSASSLPGARTQPQDQPKNEPSLQPAALQNDLFSLDFHAPPVPKSNSAPPQPPVKDVKQDILSLFSTSSAGTPAPQPRGTFGQFASTQPSWDAFGSAAPAQAQQPVVAQQQPQTTSMAGTNGTGMWGVSSGWNAPVPGPTANLWAAPSVTATTNNNIGTVNTTDIWASSSSSTNNNNNLFCSSQTSAPPKKDDIFGDLWGDFK